MKDYTAEVVELQAAYTANRVANASISTEVKSKYRARIAEEIRNLKAEVDKRFADHLARVKERSGMPLTVIQEDVLHTKSWDRWVYWRDLANIAPERVSVAEARKAKADENAAFVWDLDARKLTLKRNRAGKILSPPVLFDMETLQYRDRKWMMSAINGDAYDDHIRSSERLYSFVIDEINRAVNAGEIETPEQ